ncbi:MAG: M13 family metallopeptidase, partial [Alcanivorax sp.]|nr:M13 family metallopeptidase [Alcanivorax sp.]
VGKSYAERYFPAENKAAMVDLVANLRTAVAQSIDDIEWMSDATKKEALAKLDSFDPKIGYRDNLETYEGLAIAAANPLANHMAAAEWGWEDSLSKLGGPIDRTEWGMLPQTVNAYYNSTKNEIVFPAGILQQPFYGASADPAVNYGGIGAVIGHEIGHGFDDQGSRFDGQGRLRNWWTDEDRNNFEARTHQLITQYNAYSPLPGYTVNGELTIGENIGDLGGLSIAAKAYHLSLKGKPAPVLDGYSGDQRLLIGWAQIWRRLYREDALINRLKTDPHSPGEYRCNGIVSNVPEFYQAFEVKPGDAMYLPPDKRVQIW